MAENNRPVVLPTAWAIRRAIDIYLAEAYGSEWPETVEQRLPSAQFDVAEYLMSDKTERTPDVADLAAVRSFAIRLGNQLYPHMKLKLSRAPHDDGYLFGVDCHDAFLRASAGSVESRSLAQLKQRNATVAKAIETAWAAAGLATEKGYLRRKITEAKRRRR